MCHSSSCLLLPQAAVKILLLFSFLWYRATASYRATILIGEVSQRDMERPVYEVIFPSLGMQSAPGVASAVSVPGQSVMRMVTARGQVMRCVLPAPPTAPAQTSQAPTSDESPFHDIDELLREYEDVCYVRLDGWWTYEFCYGQHVVQKHIIPKNREPYDGEVEEKFVLGLFDSNLDRARRKNASSVATNDAAFTQLFVNGTVCDMTNEPRRVLVKYVCRDEARQLKSEKPASDLLQTVREVQSCIYEAVFMNGAICKHASYVEKVASSSQSIHCSMEQDEGPFEGLSSTNYKKTSLNL